MVMSDFSLHENLLGADYTCRFLGGSLRETAAEGAQASICLCNQTLDWEILIGDSEVAYTSMEGGGWGEKWNLNLKK